MKNHFPFLIVFQSLIILLFMPFVPSSFGAPISLKENLFGADFIDKKAGWAVGNYGKIIHTNDGGISWVDQKNGSDKVLADVAFVDENTGWVVGYGSTILHTKNGGKDWTHQKIDEDVFLTSVQFVNEKIGWAAGEWGTVFHTKDGGEVWQKQFSGDDAVFYDIDFSDELNGLAVGEFGTIYVTHDGGKTWAKKLTGVENVFFSCQALNKMTLFAAGIDSLLMRSTDGGETWKKVELYIDKVIPIYKVNFIDEYWGVICGQGFAMSTRDGGITWLPALEDNATATYVWLYDIVFTDPQNAWMVGEKGKIFNSVDRGFSWKEIDY